jgi:hypothetical protein
VSTFRTSHANHEALTMLAHDETLNPLLNTQ